MSKLQAQRRKATRHSVRGPGRLELTPASQSGWVEPSHQGPRAWGQKCHPLPQTHQGRVIWYFLWPWVPANGVYFQSSALDLKKKKIRTDCHCRFQSDTISTFPAPSSPQRPHTPFVTECGLIGQDGFAARLILKHPLSVACQNSVFLVIRFYRYFWKRAQILDQLHLDTNAVLLWIPNEKDEQLSESFGIHVVMSIWHSH